MYPKYFPARVRKRREEAEARNKLRNKLSILEQLSVIEKRPGQSLKERIRLLKVS